MINGIDACWVLWPSLSCVVVILLRLRRRPFREYSPEQLGPTLSAFANKPGGGTILLGVSERDGISVVGVDDVDDLLKRTAKSGTKWLQTAD